MARAAQRVLVVESVPWVLLLSKVGGNTVHLLGVFEHCPAVGLGGHL